MARTDHKGYAELRQWELSATASRYEHLLAAPSDAVLTKYWTAWAVTSTATACFVAVILLAIVSSRNARRRPFNLYLIYMMVPDAVYSLVCGIVCALNAARGSQTGPVTCNLQMLSLVYGVGANMWLNAVVSRELHRMLRASATTRRYQQPTPRTITKRALAIYAFCLFLGSWGLSGLGCMPVEHDWQSSLFFWLVFLPLFGGIPVAYIFYVTWDLWKQRLMPPQGKRRLLAVYFGRIVAVFVLMWLPFMLLMLVLSTWVPTWVHFMGASFSHLQGIVSTGLAMLKPDIYMAVQRFFRCRCSNQQIDDPGRGYGSEDQRRRWTFSSSSSSTLWNTRTSTAAGLFRSSRSSRSSSCQQPQNTLEQNAMEQFQLEQVVQSAIGSVVPTTATMQVITEHDIENETTLNDSQAQSEESLSMLWPDQDSDYDMDAAAADPTIISNCDKDPEALVE